MCFSFLGRTVLYGPTFSYFVTGNLDCIVILGAQISGRDGSEHSTAIH